LNHQTNIEEHLTDVFSSTLQVSTDATKINDATFGYASDVTIDDDSVIYSDLSQQENVQITPVFTLSTSGTTPITYSLNEGCPNWISIDSSTGKITMDTTEVSPGTKTTFTIISQVSISELTQSKQVTVEVEECSPQSNGGCHHCDAFNSNVCVDCKNGYELNTESSICEEDFNQANSIISQAVFFTSVGLILIDSVLNMVSPASLWMIVNQLQLLLLLLLVDTYIPPNIIRVITANSYVLFSFNFLKINSISIIGWPAEVLRFEQADINLINAGVEKGSTFVNNYSFLLLLMCLSIIHISLVCIIKKFKTKYQF